MSRVLERLSKSIVPSLAAWLVVTLWGGGALAQTCEYEELDFPGWAVAYAGPEFSISIPTSGTSLVQNFAVGVNLGAGVRFVNGFLVTLDYSRSKFDGKASYTNFVTRNQFLLRGRYAVVSSYRVDWFLGIDLGMSLVAHRYFEAQYENGKPAYKVTTLPNGTQVNEAVGTTLETSFTAFTGGASSRLNVYLTQWLALYLDVRADYTMHPDFGQDLAPLNLRFAVGVEGDF